MNLNNVYDYDGSFSDNPVVLAMYEGITTTLDEYYDSLQAPPLSALLMPQDLDAIHRVITSAKLSGNGEKRIFAIRDIMARRGFTQLAGGTNRSVFTHPNYPHIAVKVAIDNVGIHDNPAEYNNLFSNLTVLSVLKYLLMVQLVCLRKLVESGTVLSFTKCGTISILSVNTL